MISNCKLCLADCAFKGKDMKKGNCKGYIPMSNADRIRAMSDEELSEWLCQALDCDFCKAYLQNMSMALLTECAPNPDCLGDDE